MQISGNTAYAAVIGHPIAHSLSPILHNSIYGHYAMDMAYMAFDVQHEDLGEAVRGLAALGFIGFNITIPYKESIMEYLDEIDPTAHAIGAVNTVKIKNGRFIGYNTDGLGFLSSSRIHNIRWNKRRVMILGAGGSARAIGISLVAEKPGEILILNRNRSRAKHLAEDINEFAGYEISSTIINPPEDIDIIINTTPLGMWPQTDKNPLEGYIIQPNTIVCDIVYNPSMTSLLRQARDAGCLTLGGIGMLVGQGVKAIEIWTGKDIDDSIVELMSEKLCNILGG